MSNHKFKTSVIEQKHSEPKKEKSILYRPDNPRPKNSSLSQKIPDNFFLQSTEKKEIKLDNNIPLYSKIIFLNNIYLFNEIHNNHR